jgi:hypothetical protein
LSRPSRRQGVLMGGGEPVSDGPRFSAWQLTIERGAQLI